MPWWWQSPCGNPNSTSMSIQFQNRTNDHIFLKGETT
jgi:hypothetical protein